jgi:pimeloyl-ACP methyl ester carboxylesterase
MRCEPVTFRNRDGLRLFGIVHRPQTERSHPVPVILLSPGVKYRVAPHRLYVKLARHLAARGFIVLRFDFAGLGDSEGTVSEAATADFYGTVQSGRYVDDTRAAMDWMQSEYGASKFILAGLCGGAITGLLAGASDARVDALVALGLPVLVDSNAVDPTRYLTRGELDRWREGYKSKLADPKAWLRLLTFRSNYHVIFRVIAKWWDMRVPQEAVGAQPPRPPADNFNPLVPGAFEAMIAGRRVLLVFGEADRLFPIFEERLARPHAAMLQSHPGRTEICVVPGANHTFSLASCEAAMRADIDRWLGDHYHAA